MNTEPKENKEPEEMLDPGYKPQYTPQYTLTTVLTPEMKENKKLLAFAIKELISKVPANNTIKSINTTVAFGKEVIQVVSE